MLFSFAQFHLSLYCKHITFPSAIDSHVRSSIRTSLFFCFTFLFGPRCNFCSLFFKACFFFQLRVITEAIYSRASCICMKRDSQHWTDDFGSRAHAAQKKHVSLTMEFYDSIKIAKTTLAMNFTTKCTWKNCRNVFRPFIQSIIEMKLSLDFSSWISVDSIVANVWFSIKRILRFYAICHCQQRKKIVSNLFNKQNHCWQFLWFMLC